MEKYPKMCTCTYTCTHTTFICINRYNSRQKKLHLHCTAFYMLDIFLNAVEIWVLHKLCIKVKFQRWLRHKSHMLQAMASLFIAKACQRIQLSWKQLEGRAKQSTVSLSPKARRPSSILSLCSVCFTVHLTYYCWHPTTSWVYSDGTSPSIASQKVAYLSWHSCLPLPTIGTRVGNSRVSVLITLAWTSDKQVVPSRKCALSFATQLTWGSCGCCSSVLKCTVDVMQHLNGVKNPLLKPGVPERKITNPRLKSGWVG